jgi:HD-like signal output (HDOD) protein
MKANIDHSLDQSASIKQSLNLVSQQQSFVTDPVLINVEELVSEISELISLPEVYLKISELMDDPDSCLDDFAMVVSTDPALVASVLKIVNSAFFGFTGQIDNIIRALNLIGIGPLHDLVLSLSALDALDLSNDIEELVIFWKRSIYCGVISRLLAEKLHLQNAESLFVVGLLHEIGHLVLFQKYPKQCKQIIIQSQAESRPLPEIERIVFGTDYAKIGERLMSEWNLPVKFQYITGYHTTPENALEFIDETIIMHIAHQIAANKFTEEDGIQFSINLETLTALKISEDELDTLCIEADDMRLDVEKVILDKFN